MHEEFDRRQFGGLGLLFAAALVGGVDVNRPTFTASATRIADGLYAGYGDRDLTSTAQAAGAHLRSLDNLAARPMTATARLRLTATRARFAALRGRALVDVGQIRLGQRTLATAAGHARAAGDLTMIAYIAAQQAAAAIAAGDPTQALVCTANALADTRIEDPRLYAVSARAYGRLRRAAPAQTALDIAARSLDVLDAPVAGGPIPGQMSRRELDGARVDTYAHLGLPRASEGAMAASVDAVGLDAAYRAARRGEDPARAEAVARRDTQLALGGSHALAAARTSPERGAQVLRELLVSAAGMGQPAATDLRRVDEFLSVAPRDADGVTELREVRQLAGRLARQA